MKNKFGNGKHDSDIETILHLKIILEIKQEGSEGLKILIAKFRKARY